MKRKNAQIHFFGVDMYLQTEPTFKGSKCPVVKLVLYTADKPILPQKKALACKI